MYTKKQIKLQTINITSFGLYFFTLVWMNLVLYRKPCICDNSKSVGLSALKGCVILFLQSFMEYLLII